MTKDQAAVVGVNAAKHNIVAGATQTGGIEQNIGLCWQCRERRSRQQDGS